MDKYVRSGLGLVGRLGKSSLTANSVRYWDNVTAARKTSIGGGSTRVQSTSWRKVPFVIEISIGAVGRDQPAHHLTSKVMGQLRNKSTHRTRRAPCFAGVFSHLDGKSWAYFADPYMRRIMSLQRWVTKHVGIKNCSILHNLCSRDVLCILGDAYKTGINGWNNIF
jgi:hypothetical protein